MISYPVTLAHRQEVIRRENQERLARIVGRTGPQAALADKIFAKDSKKATEPEPVRLDEHVRLDRRLRWLTDQIRELRSQIQDVSEETDDYPIITGIPDEFPWRLVSFACFQSGSDMATVTVSKGAIRIHGDFAYTIPEATVTLTGLTECVFVQHARGTQAGVIAHAATAPLSNATYLYVPLCSYEADAGRYHLDHIWHFGDINVDLPLSG